jgi:hypothetical protein
VHLSQIINLFFIKQDKIKAQGKTLQAKKSVTRNHRRSPCTKKANYRFIESFSNIKRAVIASGCWTIYAKAFLCGPSSGRIGGIRKYS